MLPTMNLWQRFEENGGATLYYDANAKIVTTSDGITVTGRVTCDEIRTSDDDKIQLEWQ